MCSSVPTATPQARLTWLLCAALALGSLTCGTPRAVQSLAPQEQRSSTLQGAHFRVHVHFPADGLAAEVLAVAERTWDIAAPLYADAPRAPDTPLELHLYRDAAAYEAVDRALTGGRLQRNQAFAHYADRSAHVALQPPLPDATLRRVGLPKQTARLLAHEAAHLVRAELMPNLAAHPKWFVDGLASCVDFELLLATGRAASFELDPRAGAAWQRVHALLDAGRCPSVAQILDGDDDALPFYTRYALRWQFVEMLRTRHADAFARFVSELREVGSWWRPAARAAAAFRRAFAGHLARLDDDLAQHVRARHPVWRERGASLETVGDAWLQAAFPTSHAAAWNSRPLPAQGFRLVGRATLLPGDSAQFNLRLGTPDEFVQLAFRAEVGFSVFRYDGAWRLLGDVVPAPIEVDVAQRFEVTHDAARGTLDVTLGDSALHRDAFELPAGSCWALGAQAGSVVEWRGVELLPLDAAR